MKTRARRGGAQRRLRARPLQVLPIGLTPPLVSFIRLFDGTVLRTELPQVAI
jgi:hypothetical protein